VQGCPGGVCVGGGGGGGGRWRMDDVLAMQEQADIRAGVCGALAVKLK
jgi:hypothetical protein